MSAVRILVALFVLSSVARADLSPSGRYELDGVEGWSELYDDGPGRDPRLRLPSCGQRIRDFIVNFGRIRIDFAGDIKVNGTVWKRSGRENDGSLSVARDDLIEGYIVLINFRRAEHSRSADYW